MSLLGFFIQALKQLRRLDPFIPSWMHLDSFWIWLKPVSAFVIQSVHDLEYWFVLFTFKRGPCVLGVLGAYTIHTYIGITHLFILRQNPRTDLWTRGHAVWTQNLLKRSLLQLKMTSLNVCACLVLATTEYFCFSSAQRHPLRLLPVWKKKRKHGSARAGLSCDHLVFTPILPR